MSVSTPAGKTIIRELIEELSDSGPSDEWADIADFFLALSLDQRIRLAVRITSILDYSPTLKVNMRRP